ncbi:hypothetical protein [Saccharopolyspora shandongensis]|uniref:hypothetical protein n=1 Tax=Saccharopolyspora shandongensis TaxID=418495 RepID=UPI0033E06D9B
MTGFGVDPATLETAIKKLEDIRDTAGALVTQASQVKPSELTAKDSYTTKARQAIQERATGDRGSLRLAAEELQQKLNAKIEAYRETLREYRDSDEASAANVNQVNGQA